MEEGNAGSLVTQAGMIGKGKDKTQNTEHQVNKKKSKNTPWYAFWKRN